MCRGLDMTQFPCCSVLAVFYLSDIVTYVVAPIAYKGVLTTLTNILSNVLVSRMMLNIRDPNLFELPRHWPEELGRLSAPEPR
ncbi:hypothetical protein BD310DRAFT_883163 [Dichomitus squalens]|uniref:Uncharacterized protein n=1 Tax=Dichomitus squalens TaxID=114155 RepID=A0A4Q9PPD1_9APHY|nr:hypothetical protein BD310DRAFT_883163 [Dichomitus squalens]